MAISNLRNVILSIYYHIKDDFTDWDGVRLEPIPQKILDIYKEIYEY